MSIPEHSTLHIHYFPLNYSKIKTSSIAHPSATILTIFIDFMYFYVFMYMYVYIYYFKFAKRYVPVVGAKDNIKYIVALATLKLLSGQLWKAERYLGYKRRVVFWGCKNCHISCRPSRK